MRRSRQEPEHADAVSIATASRITGIHIHTLRYWQNEFSDFLQPIRTTGGQRRYRPADIQAVFTIKRLLKDDLYSIAGAKRFLENYKQVAA